ncbi:MAG: DUF3040 domain-containing protein [Bifidobacteriaceae bacterium]|nr:DUF3040 domain-containing protein [Bifidobacteriaceae bacterium]
MPLSEYEQRVLDQLEQQLASEDPKLGAQLAAGPPPPRRGRILLGVTIVAAGLALMISGLAAGWPWLSIIGFLVMFAGAYLSFSSPKRGPADDLAAGGEGSGPQLGESAMKAHPAKKGRLTERLEKRWEDRRGEF